MQLWMITELFVTVYVNRLIRNQQYSRLDSAWPMPLYD